MTGVLPDHWIRAHKDQIFMNGTFCETTRYVDKEITGSEVPYMGCLYGEQVEQRKVISYGISSYGYDVRIASKFKIFTPVSCVSVDPKGMQDDCFVDYIVPPGQKLSIPPNSFVLGYSVEELQIPNDVVCICIGKSTYARCGIIVNVTPLEPGWRGHITIEISNTSPLPALVYPEEGICQVMFLKGADKPENSYTSKPGGGKYQDQSADITLPKV